MRSMLVAFAAVALVAAGPAFAGGDKGQIEIGGYGGWFFPDDYGPFHPDQDNVWGGRLGYWFTQNWTLEGSYQKVMTDTEMNQYIVHMKGRCSNLPRPDAKLSYRSWTGGDCLHSGDIIAVTAAGLGTVTCSVANVAASVPPA